MKCDALIRCDESVMVTAIGAYGVMTYEAYGEPATMPTVAAEVGANVERHPQKKTVDTVVGKASEMVHPEVISLGP